MIRLEVRRTLRTDKYTEGKLFVNGEYFCDTIEDTVRILNEYEDKVYGETAIPMGMYKVVMSYSPSFKCVLPEVLNVAFFTNIRIHAGNTAEDSKGCVLVGRKLRDGYITKSKDTLKLLLTLLEGENDIMLAVW